MPDYPTKNAKREIIRQNKRSLAVWLINKLMINLLAWNILLHVFVFLNYLVNPELGINGAKIFQLIYRDHLILVSIASLIAIVSWITEDILFYKYLSRKSLGVLFLLRIFFIIVVLFLLFLLISIFHYYQKIVINIWEYFSLIKWFFLNNAAFYLFSIGILSSAFINFFKAIRQKVGYEGFSRIISGYYRKPREEDRIFIFIDLISSTHYAELLGHQRYSAFLQKCFLSLGILEIKFRAMQYQIVGDEIVLTWSSRQKNFHYAVEFFYEYVAILNHFENSFEKEFHVKPRFSASINTGKIMVSEVGGIKSEIAFHGDVLNTAARIQKQCKSYQKQLLVTKAFADAFRPVSEGYLIKWISRDKLVGKQKPVDIYSIELHNDNILRTDPSTSERENDPDLNLPVY